MKTKQRILLFSFCVFLSFASLGQVRQVKLVNGDFELDSRFKKWTAVFQLDAKRTIAHSQNSRVGGLRIGAQYNRIHRFGFGFYGLGNTIQITEIPELANKAEQYRFEFNYSTLFYERVLWFNPKWEWSAGLTLGGGKIAVHGFVAEETKPRPTESNRLATLEANVFEFQTAIQYNINWWISLGVGAGQRTLNDAPNVIKKSYSGPFYAVKLKLKIVKLSRSIFDKSVKDEY